MINKHNSLKKKINLYYFFFVIFPITVLFILGIFLDIEKTISIRERRNLSSLPEQILFNNQDTEKYIADHIPFREKILDYYFQTGFGHDFGTAKVLIGQNGWLFQNAFENSYNIHNIKSYQNKLLLSKKDLQKIISNLKIIQKWCDDHNIKLYIIFPPDKHRIYARFMPTYILRDNRPSLVKRVAAMIPKEITVVPIEDLLTIQALKKPEQYLYYKTESHWSERGAFTAYQELIKFIQRDFPDVNALTESDFDISFIHNVYSPYINGANAIYTNGNLHIDGTPVNNKNIYEHFVPKTNKEITINRKNQFQSSNYPNGTPYNVYIIGDSYTTYIHSFLSATFQRVKAHRFNGPNTEWGIRFKKRQKEMLEDKTNILILSISDLKLKDLLRIY